MVDIESDGPIPGDFSMISFGAVVVDEKLDKTFYGQLAPISEKFIPEALAVSGHTREETLQFNDARKVMDDFEAWLKSISRDRPVFISDNNGFDWMFICWYFADTEKRIRIKDQAIGRLSIPPSIPPPGWLPPPSVTAPVWSATQQRTPSPQPGQKAIPASSSDTRSSPASCASATRPSAKQ